MVSGRCGLWVLRVRSMRKQSPRLSHEGGSFAGLLASGFSFKFSVPGRQMGGIKRAGVSQGALMLALPISSSIHDSWVSLVVGLPSL